MDGTRRKILKSKTIMFHNIIRYMKLFQVALFLCSCAGFASANETVAPLGSRSDFNITVPKAKVVLLAQAQGKLPGVEALFNAIAITVPPNQKRQFLVGDNIAGYFEGYTHNYLQGGGYLMKNAAVFTCTWRIAI